MLELGLTRVSFVQNTREFHSKLVSYFAKNALYFAKFRVSRNWFRMLRNKAFNKRNETKLQHRTNQNSSFAPFENQICIHAIRV